MEVLEARVGSSRDEVHAEAGLLGSEGGCDREAAGRASCPQRKLFDPRRVDAPVFVTVCKYRPLKLTFTWDDLDRVRGGAAARKLPQSTCRRPLGRTRVGKERQASVGRPGEGRVGALKHPVHQEPSPPLTCHTTATLAHAGQYHQPHPSATAALHRSAGNKWKLNDQQ
ncbi:hypothetical protein E2C01_076537 [Portunus trituberculatus]|uniref:Uncharacterized protein n=1 Tax=Portunus trituberculatus TaxID=210409 RepID=A0A5B7IMA9_PORTR|nr:hypothetical protein [Portunus trituberculatus]